jgi:mannitol-1-phosphate/altronate dehydrogenase
MLFWSGHSNSNPEMVKSVAAIPEVSKVEIKPTEAGASLKEAAGSKTEALVVFAPH